MRILLIIIQLMFWPGCTGAPTPAQPEPELAELRLQVHYFTASWCQPCQRAKPRLNKLIRTSPNTDFHKVDVVKNEPLTKLWNVTKIPTYVVRYAGEEVFRTRDIAKLESLVREFEQRDVK